MTTILEKYNSVCSGKHCKKKGEYCFRNRDYFLIVCKEHCMEVKDLSLDAGISCSISSYDLLKEKKDDDLIGHHIIKP